MSREGAAPIRFPEAVAALLMLGEHSCGGLSLRIVAKGGPGRIQTGPRDGDPPLTTTTPLQRKCPVLGSSSGFGVPAFPSEAGALFGATPQGGSCICVGGLEFLISDFRVSPNFPDTREGDSSVRPLETGVARGLHSKWGARPAFQTVSG